MKITEVKIGLLLAALAGVTCGFTACSSLTGSTVPSPSTVTVEKSILAACDVFDTAMPFVAQGVRSGKISKTGQARIDIDKAIKYAAPICGRSPIPTSMTDAALAELFHSGATLAAAKGQ